MKTIIILLSILLSFNNLWALTKDERINYWIKEYTVNRRSHFQSSLNRSGLYRKTIVEIFKAKGVPEQLSWLPLIESGFKCGSKSNKNAAGCWQFIKSTGNAHGLTKDSWKDQRYDFNDSTIAAADYLLKLYNQFKDWDLALAAYNTGPHNVKKAIKKSWSKDYWSLKLSQQTMDYIPKYHAVLSIVKDLKKYGFKIEQNDLVAVKLKKGSHNLKRISRILMVNYKDFIDINPGYEIGYTDPNEEAIIYLKKDWDGDLLEIFGLKAE